MLSLVIPFYNCEKNVADTVEKVIAYREKYNPQMEFIAVDDGSSDKTLSEIKRYENRKVRVISCGKNKGKGGAIREGVLAAKGGVIIFTDADLAYGLEPVAQFTEKIKTSHIVTGTRRQDTNIAENYGFARTLASKTFSDIAESLLHLGVGDTQCGFKAYRADVAKELFQSLETYGFGFDVEILYKAKKQGFTITELPVKMLSNEKKTTVSFIKDGTKMLYEIMKLQNL